MEHQKFPENFLFGTASAAYQIEGAWNADGKGESIWDRWTHIPGTCEATGDTACDHYHRYKEDIQLLKELGVDAYRFSIAWTRIFPDGYGSLNRKGLDFYKDLVQRLKQNGIKPVVTLYHWDLPQKLQDIGGWVNPKTAEYFDRYAECLFDELGDDVESWITFNEPYVVAFMGYHTGRFAPGIRDFSSALKVCHNMLLAHGMAVRTFRKKKRKGKIGITLDYFPALPASEREEDKEAAERDRDSHLRWFADPIFRGRYPQRLWKHYQERGVVMPETKEEDFVLISAPVDFLGINFYRGSVISDNKRKNWPLETEYIPNDTEKDSAFYRLRPERLYEYLMELHEEYGGVDILISENGYSNHEFVNRYGQIMDYDRIDYISRHLEQCRRAIEDGVPLIGYFVWSFLDDLEWTGGYKSRMGLVYVDYRTQKRIVKESGKWYRQVIRERRLVEYQAADIS